MVAGAVAAVICYWVDDDSLGANGWSIIRTVRRRKLKLGVNYRVNYQDAGELMMAQ